MKQASIDLRKKTPVGTPLPERIRKCFRLHPEWPDRRVAAAMRCQIDPVKAVRGGAGVGAVESIKQRGKTLGQFRAQFDVRERIRAGIKRHLNGVYMTDQEFREACGIPAQDWRRFADLDEFEPYRWRYRAVIYWAQPKMIASMKETVGAV